jgi:hypothetical protein
LSLNSRKSVVPVNSESLEISDQHLQTMITMLIEKNANINNNTAHVDIVNLIEDMPRSISNVSPLMSAIFSRNFIAIEEILDNKECDINYQEPVDNLSALHIACGM